MAELDGWLSKLHQRFQALISSATAQSLLTIFSGQFFAQLLSFLATFLLASLYGPRAFSNLAIVVSISSVLTPFLSGTLENPIVLERNLRKSMRLVMASFVLISMLSFGLIALSIGCQILDDSLSVLARYQAILGYSTLAIVVATLSASRLVCEAVLLRQHRLGLINRLLMVSAISNPLFALLAWKLGFVDEGLNIALLFAYLMQFAFYAVLLPDAFKMRFHLGLAWQTLLKYKTYPLLLSSTSVLDSLTTSLPVVLGLTGQSALTIGNYAFMQRIFLVPINVLTAAVSKSYLSHSAAKLGLSPQHFFRYTIQFAVVLSISAIAVIGLVASAADPLLSHLVASKWRQSFTIFSVLAPSLVCKIVSSSLSSSLLSMHAKNLLASWKIIAFIFTYFSLSYAAHFEYASFFRVLMVNDSALYLLLLAMIFYACRPKITLPHS